MQPLEIIVKGDTSQANAALQKTQEELVKTSVAAKKANDTFKDLEKGTQGIIKVSKEITSLQESAKKSGISLKELALNSTVPFSTLTETVNKSKSAIQGAISINKQFGDVAAALAEKNKVLSQGIQLAIDKISLMHDASKKAESGIKIFGFGISELLPMLTGPAGIGIALTVASVAIDLFKDKVYKVDLKPLADQVAEAAKKEKEFKDSVNQASAAVVSQAKDIADLKAVIIDTTSATVNLTDATIKQGVAQFLFDQKNLALQKLLTAEIQKQIRERKINNPMAGSFLPSQATRIDPRTGGLIPDKIQREIDDAKNEIIGINQLSKGLEKLFENLLKTKEIKVKKIKVKPEKIEVEKPEKLPKLFDVSEDPTQLSRASGSTLTPTVVVKPKFVVDEKAERRANESLEDFLKRIKLEKFQADAIEAINSAISNVVAETISTAADAIVDVIANKGENVPRLFDNLIKGIGGQIKELGKYLVKAGAEMLIAKNAIKELGLTPQTAIVAGVALQVLGGLLAAAASKKASSVGFATGTRNSPGGTFLVGERGPERVFLPGGSAVQPNNELTAYGGGGHVFIPSVTLAGTDLVIAFNRASQAMNRNN